MINGSLINILTNFKPVKIPYCQLYNFCEDSEFQYPKDNYNYYSDSEDVVDYTSYLLCKCARCIKKLHSYHEYEPRIIRDIPDISITKEIKEHLKNIGGLEHDLHKPLTPSSP